jgi:hypothetical protein
MRVKSKTGRMSSRFIREVSQKNPVMGRRNVMWTSYRRP